jgi:hypothetical protein
MKLISISDKSKQTFLNVYVILDLDTRFICLPFLEEIDIYSPAILIPGGTISL